MRWTIWMAVAVSAVSLGCTGKVQVKAAAPPPPVAKAEPAPAPAPEPAKITYLEISERIQFEPGKAILLDGSKHVLDEVVAMLNEHSDIDLVEIEGHTDWIGNEGNNLALSTHRAESVRDYLVSKGVAKERLAPKGYGEMKPVADNTTSEGRETNRRVSFRVVKQGGQLVEDKSVAGQTTAGTTPNG